MPIISVDHLSKTYEYYKKDPGLMASVRGLFHRETLYAHAVKDMSFSIDEGEFVGFLGPNGAGKTTTLKMLSGILYPTSGDVSVLGYTPSKRQAAFQKQFAIVMGQKNQLWWDLPPMESFLLNKAIYQIPDAQFKKTLDELVALLDISHILDVQVRKLSLGERMKCELVAALLHGPKVLFLDEPTIGLDVVSQNNIRQFLKTYNKEKKTTIILTSHYMEDVEALCDRVLIINHGSLVYDGALHTLISQYAKTKQITVSFSEHITKKTFSTFGEVILYDKGQAVIEVQKSDARHVASTLLSTLPIEDIGIKEVSVEEVIRMVFSEKK